MNEGFTNMMLAMAVAVVLGVYRDADCIWKYVNASCDSIVLAVLVFRRITGIISDESSTGDAGVSWVPDVNRYCRYQCDCLDGAGEAE